MILQLSVENFKSINKRIIFSMVATHDELHDDYLKKVNNHFILPSSIIIGTNGAGKSNLFLALKYLQTLLKSGEISSFYPHKLSEKNQPTQIDVQFLVDNKRVFYGIDVVSNQVVNEFLYLFDDNEEKIIFDRDFENYGQNNFSEVIKKHSSSNKILLSLLNQFSNDEFVKKVYNFLTEQIVIVSTNEHEEFDLFQQSVKTFKKDKNQLMITELLSNVNIGIKKFYLKNDKIIVSYENLELDLLEESTGTKKLFSLLVLLNEILKNGKIIIFDELEKNLHLALIKYFIYLFNEKSINSKNAQLIFTTHNSSLLDLSTFRRDQVWFMEKNLKEMNTECYSLYNILNVEQNENIEKGYILGKYGATFKFIQGGVGIYEK